MLMFLSTMFLYGQIFEENQLLEYLPMKMRTDLAMRVHFPTLGKVKLFKNCEPGLLKDLVVHLKLVIYLPGDYICRKGDKGKEMFIIKTGQVGTVQLCMQQALIWPRGPHMVSIWCARNKLFYGHVAPTWSVYGVHATSSYMALHEFPSMTVQMNDNI